MAYKRALLKLSGEQLAGKYEFGVDPEIATYFAKQIKDALATHCQLTLVVGGGNMVRGAEVAGNGIRRVTADQMGMLSGLINCMALTDIFEDQGIPTRCLSMVSAELVAENYSYRRADKHLGSGRVVIVAGGVARPYFTHDTAAVSVGLELGCEVVLKATKVDGVYDKDPAKHTDAQLVPKMSLQDAVSNQAIAVMDKAALGLALEQSQPLIVFNPMIDGNIRRVISGEALGTHIS
jgi:uridylate kinase